MAADEKLGKTMFFPLAERMVVKFINENKVDAEAGTVYVRARNNFRIVSCHDDWPNSFLLGHVSFLAGQMYMMNYSFRGP